MVAPHSAGARTASTLRPGYWDRLVLEEFWRTVVECNVMLISIDCIFSFLYYTNIIRFASMLSTNYRLITPTIHPHCFDRTSIFSL